MSGWCRTRCPVCPARSSAARAASTASAAAWTSFRPDPSWAWSIRRCGASRPVLPGEAGLASRFLRRRDGSDVERRVALLVALVDHDAFPRVDDFVALNEYGVLLRFAVGVELEAGEPCRPLEVVDQPHPGD